MKIRLLLILSFLCGVSTVNAQLQHNPNEPERCAISAAMLRMKQHAPDRYERYQALPKETRSINTARSEATLIIPVVFHVLHRNGVENISEEQIHDAMRILNEDFNLENPNRSEVVYPFNQILGNVNIRFELARIAPNGRCFEGITRTVSTNSPSEGFEQWDEILEGNDIYNDVWSHASYLNIIVAENVIEGAAAYTYKPNEDEDVNYWNTHYNSIYSKHEYVGSIGTGAQYTSRVLTHEVGHWLNLSHVWGDEPIGTCGDDYVYDTPTTRGSTYGCNLNQTTCDNQLDNVQNFMDYSYCYANFTEGQAYRMRDALDSDVGGRYNLWTPENHQLTGISAGSQLCNAKVSSSRRKVCINEPVTFQLANFTNTQATVEWTLNGSSIPSSSVNAPVVTYATPGVYNVSVTITLGANQITLEENQYITVEQLTSTQMLPLVEGFTATQFVPENWSLIGTNNNLTWFRSNQYGNQPTTGNSMYANTNEVGNRFSIKEIELPIMDFTNQYNANLSFDVAYTIYSKRRYERLEVWASPGCGLDFVPVYGKQGQILQTEQDSTLGNYTPNTWRRETIDLNDFSNKSQVRVRMAIHGGAGNNLFIDNIELTGVEGTPIPNFTVGQGTKCVNSTITFQDSSFLGHGWTWDFGQGAFPATASGQGPHNVVYNVVGTKQVTLTLGNGQTITKPILIDACLGVDELSNEWTIMYPNPAKDQFTVKSNVAIDQITVMDLYGRIIEQQIGWSTDEYQMSVSNWSAGTYIIEIINGLTRQTLKLVKE